MGEVNAQLLTHEISTLSPQQLQEVMHFVGYLKSQRFGVQIIPCPVKQP